MKKPAKQHIILTAIAVIFIALGAFAYYYFHSATFIIQVAPINATVSIDDREYKNGLFQTAPKDQVSATISAPGFKTKTINLSLKKGKINKLLTYLAPENNDWSYYEKSANQESLSILLTNLGYQSWDLFKINSNLTTDQDNSADALVKKLSIKTSTPIQFSICGVPATRSNCDAISITYDYSPDCNNSLCLIISGRRPSLIPETLNLTKTKITEAGFNLDNYSYTYQQTNY